MPERCEYCCEFLEEDYCYHCDGLEDKRDQITVVFFEEELEDGVTLVH